MTINREELISKITDERIDEKINEIKNSSKYKFKEWFKGFVIRSIKCFLFKKKRNNETRRS